MVPREGIEALRPGPPQEMRLLEAVLEQLPVAVVIVDADEDAPPVGSAHARRLLGEHSLAAPPLRGPDGKPIPPAAHPVRRTLGGGAPAENELYQLARPSGPLRLVAVTTTRVHAAEGDVRAVVVLYDDVTERTRRARAEREFVANAAHELRTPLAAIAGAIEVLQAGAKELPHERDLFLSHIQRETDRLTRLARALLLIARAQTSPERPRAAIVPLKPLLEEVAETLHPAEGVEVSVRCPATLAALTSRDLVEQALANLSQNAARHTVKGVIRLRGRAEDDAVSVEVVDSGPGIPEDARDRAFDRFFSAGHGGEGYGLGLSIARQAVEAAGGSLELESSRRGTTARIRLPLARLVRPA
jgi:signal transduction histidine kinase